MKYLASLLILVTAPVFGQLVGEPAEGVYHLDRESDGLVGCLDLCRCAIREVPDLVGTFTLEYAEVGATFSRFEVRDIDWTLGTDETYRATGSGIYETRIDDRGISQRFELELKINDRPPQAFVSESVIRSERGDRIVASIRPAEQVCRGEVYRIVARQVEGISPLSFVRGDCNADGSGDLSDAVGILLRLFRGNAEAPCVAACDLNGDERLDISDAISQLQFLFLGGQAPVQPFPECGPRDSLLGCDSFPPCA